MRTLISFFILSFLKTFSRLFYRIEVRWLGSPGQNPWKNIRVLCFLNHTSLYEFLYVMAVPYRALWDMANRGVAIGADKTLNLPVVGIFWRLIMPKMISTTRKRDETWLEFMNAIGEHSMVVIAPEGRMMRPGGLDREGRPMSIRGGIADVLEAVKSGKLLIAYSGGLHHIQIPDQKKLPHLFKTIKVNLEIVDIGSYLESFEPGELPLRKLIVRDLEERKLRNRPVL